VHDLFLKLKIKDSSLVSERHEGEWEEVGRMETASVGRWRV
jgi:hypothetical protein